MGRPIRRQEPGQYYLITTRCHQARFFLRPDSQLNAAVLEWLARGQKRFPNIRIHAVCVMSNHLHLVLRDEASELAPWASYVLGNLARAVNRIRGRSGSFFERRYSAEPILDIEALHDRLVYVVTNPVKASLCERASQWAGVLLYAPDQQRKEIPVSWVDRDAYRQAKPRGGDAPLDRKAFGVAGTLVVDPIPAFDGPGAATVAASIEARERELAVEQRKARRLTLSPARVLAQHWHDAPKRPERSARPLCHATDPAIRATFKKSFQEFMTVFWEASQRLRDGVSRVEFPAWSFPPGSPLVQPTAT
jgi:REP element-mobilizing transposase RayT